MSLADTNTPLNILKNPINVQKLVVDDVLDRWQGKLTMVDPNNVAMHLIEMASTLTANFSASAERALAAGNSLRAQTSEDLAKHMSDYDYVGMYSTPSTTQLLLTLSKNHLITYGKDFNDVYKKIVIPKDTIFVVGDTAFGIYYPIEIRINKSTGAVLVVHDTEETNPLLELNQNIVNFTEQTFLNTKFLGIKIPVYQFVRQVLTEDTIPGRGFAKQYSYIDKFYAVRIFTILNDKKVELSQSFAVDTYDPTKPTARLMVYPEQNKFTVNIPQVYFSNGQIGSKIIIELFVTKGEIDMDISTIPPESIRCQFNTSVVNDPYSKVLDTHPDATLAVATSRISGGSDGLTFEERRQRVVNSAFYATSLTTPMDLQAFFEDSGFRAVKYKDDLTNLIYFVYRALEDDTNTIVPATTGQIKLVESTPTTVSSIKKYLDGLITILPTTLYRYSSSDQACAPVTDTDMTLLAQMTKKELVSEFNSTEYMRSPFHIRLIQDGRYSKASSYNLMNPYVEDIVFEKENSNILAQMVTGAATIHHQNNGSGGYRVQFLVNKSQDLLQIPEDQLYVYLYTESSDGMLVGLRLNYIGMLGEAYLYDGVIETDYYISRDHLINATSLTDGVTEWEHLISLKGKFHLVFMVNKDYFSGVYTEPSMYTGVPQKLQSKYAVMIRQSCTIELGHALDDVVYNDTELSWTGKDYARWLENVYMTYPTDVYQTDENGIPVLVPDAEGVPQLVKLHDAGDVIYDDYNQPRILYAEGSVRYDQEGKPIIISDRVKQYYINALMVDARLYLSEHPTQKTYREKLTKVLESYFTTVRTAIDKLLERDFMYFRPLRTMGNAKFYIGDGAVINMALNMKFKFKCHVAGSIVADTAMQQVIKEAIIAIVEPLIKVSPISLTDIANQVKAKIDSIESIDVLGINDTVDLQTISIDDNSVQPSISQELYLTESGTLAVQKAVDIEFVSI
jgi:hypothetical protein